MKLLTMAAVAACSLLMFACPQVQAKPPQGTPAAKHGCSHSHSYKQAKRGLNKALRHHTPMSQAMGARGWHYVRCVRVPAHQRWLSNQRKRLRAWRRSYAHVWPIRFNSLSAVDQQWAVNTSSCEAGMNPATNTGNGYYGAFQFLPSTWYAAGGTGNPAQHSWHYQAVIAVNWRNVAGASQWPQCGV